MIFFTDGSIFDSDAEAIVNPVNCEGVAGGGLAREFKRRYPAEVALYTAECKVYGLQPGQTFVTPTDERLIFHTATKDKWRLPSTLEYIEKCLGTIKEAAIACDASTIAMPALGCGLGGLNFDEVSALMRAHYVDSALSVTVFYPRLK